MLGPGRRLIKKGILSGRGLTKVEKHWLRLNGTVQPLAAHPEPST